MTISSTILKKLYEFEPELELFFNKLNLIKGRLSSNLSLGKLVHKLAGNSIRNPIKKKFFNVFLVLKKISIIS